MILRFYEKLRRVHDGIPLKPGPVVFDPDIHLDDVYAFFVFCHSLKDWIKNDELIETKTKKKAEHLVTNRSCLRYCADIANGIKHLEFDNQRSKIRPRFKQLRRTVFSPSAIAEARPLRVEDLEGGLLFAKDSYYLKTDEGTKEVFDLATECVNTWKKFIDEKILQKEKQVQPIGSSN